MVRRVAETFKDGLKRVCRPEYGCQELRTEVDEIAWFLGLGHHAEALRREDVTTLAVLARMSDADMASAGVYSAAARLLLRTAAKGLQVQILNLQIELKIGRIATNENLCCVFKND